MTARGRRRPTKRSGTAQRAPRRWLRRLALVLAACLIFAVGLAWPVLVRGPLVVGQDAISDAGSRDVPVVIKDDDGRYLIARPPAGVAETDVLVVIFSGGLVRPQAYEWLARREAEAGRVTIIPEFAFDLPILQPDRAKGLIGSYGKGKKVVLIGHSLGGAVACQFVADQARWGVQPVDGLVLLASYPADNVDLSAVAGLKAISLRAQNDTVADAGKVAAGLKRLPKQTSLVQIDGAVHSFFGRYGPQSGDGVATVSRSDAENRIVAAIDAFIGSL